MDLCSFSHFHASVPDLFKLMGVQRIKTILCAEYDTMSI